ncbi:hypothetical protein FHW37_108139 [Neorhizobium alkalisoli]|uniref:Uncharacterized protein n=1 Tax=Neorhizobium alkalisoli TaxID=528178 RepID=A0A561QGG4_9HYPH|nr:hypothetical protein FHW37_108139 [Neorhizobium alkalisoli]
MKRFCDNCHNTGLVCQSHLRRPFTGSYGCGCGEAGVKCPVCRYEPREPDLSSVLEFEIRCHAVGVASAQ